MSRHLDYALRVVSFAGPERRFTWLASAETPVEASDEHSQPSHQPESQPPAARS